MNTKYDVIIDDQAVLNNLKKLTNQIYKLLPNREEGIDWKIPLQTIIEEIAGMNEVLIDQHEILFPLLCKLEGLLSLDLDFFEYRRIIFECLNLIGSLIKKCQD